MPALFSFAMLWLARRKPGTGKALILVWLPLYVWINGVPEFPSRDATNWLWLAALLAAAAVMLVRQRSLLATAHSTVLLAGLLTIAWPVIHLISVAFTLTLGAALLVGGLIYYLPNERATLPITATAVNTAGIGLVSALGGSLLVGQLAIALAVVLGAFTLAEIFSRKTRLNFPSEFLAPFVTIDLLLLVIGRVYADLPIGPVVLLLISPLVGLLLRWRYSVVVSTSLVLGALLWLLVGSGSSNYY